MVVVAAFCDRQRCSPCSLGGLIRDGMRADEDIEWGEGGIVRSDDYSADDLFPEVVQRSRRHRPGSLPDRNDCDGSVQVQPAEHSLCAIERVECRGKGPQHGFDCDANDGGVRHAAIIARRQAEQQAVSAAEGPQQSAASSVTFWLSASTV